MGESAKPKVFFIHSQCFLFFKKLHSTTQTLTTRTTLTPMNTRTQTLPL
jgi:hypothetical protein